MSGWLRLSNSEPIEVVVVGGGIGGTVAACHAQEFGCRTILLDKCNDPTAGSNTRLSGGGLHIAHADILSTPERLRHRIDEVTGGTSKPDLADALAANCGRAVDWLKSHGVELEPASAPGDLPRLNAAGEPAEVHYIAPRRSLAELDGWQAHGAHRLLQILQQRFVAAGGTLIGEATALELLESSRGRGVAGVVARVDGEAGEIRSRNVVLADGGFQANKRLLVTYIGRFADRIKLRGSSTGTGDALLMAERVRGQLIGLQYFYGHLLHRGALVDDRLWPMPLLDGLARYGIIVSNAGLRYQDEGRGGIAAANSTARLDNPVGSWIVLDAQSWSAAERELTRDPYSPPPIPGIEERGGSIVSGVNLAELAAACQINSDQLSATVSAFNTAHESDKLHLLPVPRTGAHPASIGQPPFRAVPVVPGITMTMGGILVDASARVVDLDDRVIPGLYAVGGSAGGLQGGPGGGYVGGLSPALTFGLLAAEHIANRSRAEVPSEPAS